MTRRKLLVAVFISAVLAPFVFFSSSLKPWQGDTPVMTVWHELLYRVDYARHLLVDGVSDIWGRYVDLTDVSEQNKALRGQLAMLQSRVMDYEEQIEENRRLRKLLGFAENYDRRMLVAEVIGHYNQFPYHGIRISRGEFHGLKVGMPVIAADGIVGRIVRTGSAFSDVQLMVDANFNLDVLLQRTRVRGVLAGTAGDHCRLNLHKRAEIRIGDTVITSGIVGSFPKGLPVGRVIRISYDTDAVSQNITIEPWVDYRRLEEVMVLNYQDLELQRILETAGNGWIEKTTRNWGG